MTLYTKPPPPASKSNVRAEFTGETNDDPFDTIVNEGVDPERLLPGVRYEFSVAPADQHENADIDERAKRIVDEWIGWLNTILGGSAEYDLITECSTPKYNRYLTHTLNRVHFHGYITFTDYGRFKCERAHLLCKHCTFKISIFRPDVWPAYILKDEYAMKPFLGSRYNIKTVVAPNRSLSAADRRGIPRKAQRGIGESEDRSVARTGVSSVCNSPIITSNSHWTRLGG